MNRHINNILETVDKLKAIGEEINPSHVSALFLCSLPPSYDTLITALEAKSEDELTPQFISSKLIDEFNKRNEHTQTSEHSSKAFQAKKGYTSQGHKNEKYCRYCKKSSHMINDCWHLKRKNSTNNKFSSYNTHKPKQNHSSLCFETREKQNTTPQSDIEQTTSKIKDLVFLANPSEKATWLIDSGSSSHITNNKDLFRKINNTEKTNVMIANGKSLISHCSGDIALKAQTSNGKTNHITLKDVLFVPDLESNLLSVRKATEIGCKVIFENQTCKLLHNGEVYLEGKVRNNLYEVMLNQDENFANLAHECHNQNCIHLWHRRLGHRNIESLKEIKTHQLATGIDFNNCKHNNQCETCIKSKLTATPYPKSTQNRATKILQLIHSDVCGPVQVPSIGGKTYILTFIDDYSRYTKIYLLTRKNEVFSKLKEYISEVTNEFGRKPQMLRSDNGGEYINEETDNYLKEMGIKRQLTTPHCPSQNGVAERKNRSLIEMTRCLLSDANLPQKLWGEAINTANYLQNRLPTKANTKTPFEMWHNKKPNLSHIKVFGCKAFAQIDKSKRGKLDDKATEGIFVGYDVHSKAYRIFVEGNHVTISRSVRFLENENQSADTKTKINPNSDTAENTNTFEINIDAPPETQHTDSNNSDIAQPRRSERSNKGVPPDRFIYLTKNNKVYEPKDYKDVLNIVNPHEKQNWLKAMEEEIKSLEDNGTWTLVKAPPGRKIIGSKWTYKIKYNQNGDIIKYKARLVAKGYSQKYGEDFDETFAPVVSHTTIRTFLAAAVHKNLKVDHIDIKTAFLHGELDEEIFMNQPEGYAATGNSDKVCKLRKAIYGLKQAARAWNIKIEKTLKNLGFTQSTADACLFTNRNTDDTIYIIIYVDDILIAGQEKQIKQTVEQLEKEFELNNLGAVSHYLGITIRKTNNGSYTLHQKQKINELVKKFHLDESRPCNTPMECGYLKDNNDDNLLPNNTHYREAIGALLYIATLTRPDIAAAVNILSRRNESPREKDWNQAKRVIRYLNTTKDLELEIHPGPEAVLSSFADADWAGDTSDRKSTTGNLFLLGKSPIQWLSRKQPSVALSSAEAEYVSAASAAQEIQWLIRLLADLDMPQQLPIKLFDDNQSAIKMVELQKYNSKTKHIDIKYHAIRNLKESGIIDLHYCPTKEMTADLFTKPLPKPDFLKHRNSMQLIPDNTSGIKGDC